MLLLVGISSAVVMLTACANVVLLSVVPLRLRGVVNSGNFSAIMNAFASIAVAFTTTLSGAIIDSKGGNNWQAFYMFGVICIAVNLLIALCSSVFWKRKIEKIVEE